MENDTKTTELNRKIGQRIMMLRGKESQAELAAAIGSSREIVNHWERGSRNIKADSIVALAKHFGVTADFLLGLTNKKASTVEAQAITGHTGLNDKAIDELHKLNERIEKENKIGFVKTTDEMKLTAINTLLENYDFSLFLSIYQYIFLEFTKFGILPTGQEDNKEVFDNQVSVYGIHNDDGQNIQSESFLFTSDMQELHLLKVLNTLRKLREMYNKGNGGAGNGVHKTKD